MPTPASIAGHPVHPMLVGIPIGLWVFSLVCDFAALASADTFWFLVATYALLGGEVGAVLAAVPGIADMLHILKRHGPRARRVVLMHMGVNAAIVVIVAVNLWLRASSSVETYLLPLSLSIIAVAMLGVSGWLGGELVHVLGVSTAREPAPTLVPDAPRAGSEREAHP